MPFLLMLSGAAGCSSQSQNNTPRSAQTQTSTPSAATVKVQPQVAAAPVQVSEKFAARVREIGAAGRLDEMERSNFSDYKQHFIATYEATGYAPLWLQADGLSPQGEGVIRALEQCDRKGLDPKDYDSAKWPQRVEALKTSADAQKADFDAALTVATMRYISDLHIGRVNPKHFKFGIDAAIKKYDLPQFLNQQVIHAADIQEVLAEVEPAYNGYRRTEDVLVHYLELEKLGDGASVPAVTKGVGAGDAYVGVPALVARLRLLGDMPAGGAVQDYDSSVADAVKHFQVRHGLTPDGKLGAATVRELNVPIASRVRQLGFALERWRWMPPDFPHPPVVVNIPEFRLRAFEEGQKIALAMNVVVGRAAPTQTPVFTDNIRFIVLRPYWNVPMSIVRSSVIPGIQRSGTSYLTRQRMEVSGGGGDLIAGLRSGRYTVRQKPGPQNSLGLIKFMFPNSYNVYLHSTPATELFSQSRRDFSHGCIRLEKPAELAAFLLRNQDGGKWTTEAVQKAMDSGPDNRTINLQAPVPVLILYATAVVAEDGSVHFFDDIYGHDRRLNDVLKKGTPYPW
ncbi:L,D-transpeptidase family protein [Edaphobacter albus]|uniref:L,D-transpeptidase family protein n=1 Tax=Edaphobacter sp. 4G125 TaxID=2763071 RepID=UPI0016459729|nr:L,D-transpeptidase family protein [Edaphobacter sp. 4G125]QNI35246.1 L,D-transpeptidase family protein [Edaphobacter sp. 4G125]